MKSPPGDKRWIVPSMQERKQNEILGIALKMAGILLQLIQNVRETKPICVFFLFPHQGNLLVIYL